MGCPSEYAKITFKSISDGSQGSWEGGWLVMSHFGSLCAMIEGC